MKVFDSYLALRKSEQMQWHYANFTLAIYNTWKFIFFMFVRNAESVLKCNRQIHRLFTYLFLYLFTLEKNEPDKIDNSPCEQV